MYTTFGMSHKYLFLFVRFIYIYVNFVIIIKNVLHVPEVRKVRPV